MKKIKPILFFLFILSFKNPMAQVLSMDSIIHAIDANNPWLRMYDDQSKALSSYAEMSDSWMPPSFSTGLWQTPYNEIKDGMWMFSATQMIPNPKRKNAQYNYMQGMVTAEQQSRSVKRIEMIASAKMRYTEWVLLKRKYKVIVEMDSLLNYILKISQVRYAYNKEKLNSVYKAKADLYEVRNMEIMLNGEMKMKNLELNTIMGIDKTISFDIDTILPSDQELLQTDDASKYPSSRSDIKLMDITISNFKLQQLYESSKTLPEFGVSVSHMQSLGMMPAQYSIMGMVSIPMFPWSNKESKSKITGLQYEIGSATNQKMAMLNEVSGNIAVLKLQMKTAREELVNYHDNIVTNYYNSYQSAMTAYEQNTEELFMVLDALKMYRMAKITELDKWNEYYKIKVSYEKELEIF